MPLKGPLLAASLPGKRPIVQTQELGEHILQANLYQIPKQPFHFLFTQISYVYRTEL